MNFYIRFKKLIILLAVLIIAVPTLVACGEDKADEARKSSVEGRTDNFAKAESMYPAPTDLTNFPMRGALLEFTYRQDEVNHPWYIYVLSPMSGEPVGYFVGKTYPQNACNFLSDATRYVDLPDQQWGETSAPSYDGVYYGNGQCAWFFFDITTNAMHTFVSEFWYASDQPLNLDVQRLGTTGEGNTDPVAPSTPEPVLTPAPVDPNAPVIEPTKVGD